MDAAADRDIADSTDWHRTPLAGLVAVEAALRCEVCKDFYNTPMLTSCSHTFCSVCIRRALSNDGKCPFCRKDDQELKLRNNYSIQDAVKAFTIARPTLLQVARQPPEQQAPVPNSASPKRGLEYDSDDNGSRRSSKRLRSSARASKTRAIESTAEIARQEVDLTYSPETSPEPNDGLVACPVCLQRMKEVQVFPHLEASCPGEPQKQKPKRSNTANTILQNKSTSNATIRTAPTNLERLPAINYSMFKEVALRKKLQELGISANGPKALLEKRHKEWMTLWNANCDSLEPRKKSDLLRELDTWERTQGYFAPTSSKSANQGAQIKSKDFDGTAWAAKHEDSFKDLIANARKSRAKAQAPGAATEATQDKQLSNEPAHEPIPEQPEKPIQETPRNGFPDGEANMNPAETRTNGHDPSYSLMANGVPGTSNCREQYLIPHHPTDPVDDGSISHSAGLSSNSLENQLSSDATVPRHS